MARLGCNLKGKWLISRVDSGVDKLACHRCGKGVGIAWRNEEDSFHASEDGFTYWVECSDCHCRAPMIAGYHVTDEEDIEMVDKSICIWNDFQRESIYMEGMYLAESLANIASNA